MFSAFVVVLLASGCSAPEPTQTSAFRDRRDGARLLEFDDVSLRTRTSTGEALSLQADRFLHAKRQSASGFITYHGFSEFLLTDARVVVESSRHTSFSRLAQCVRQVFDAFGQKSGQPRPTQSADDDETEPADAPIPSRAIFEPFALVEETRTGRLALHARRARLQLESGVLVLEGAVRIDGFQGERIEAKEAVLSPHENGLFLPLGHRRDGGVPMSKGVFLVAADGGDLVASRGGMTRSYDDPFHRQERAVLTHYARHAPPSLQPFIHALLVQLSRTQPLER